MKNIFRSFEAQRPSLPSAPSRPHRYEPSLHLSMADISAMFPQDVAPTHARRQSLVHDERRRRHSLQPQAPHIDRRRTKDKISYEQYGECLVDVSLIKAQQHSTQEPRRANVVLFDESQYDLRSDQHNFRHSMPSQYCY